MGKVVMGKRIDWLNFVVRHKRPKGQLFIFFAFEIYYQLCTLRGYRPRHLLDPMSEELRAMPSGQPILAVWPRRLPLSIRVLSRILPFGGYHHELIPYTPEVAATARASGRRAEIVQTVPGELRLVGSS